MTEACLDLYSSVVACPWLPKFRHTTATADGNLDACWVLMLLSFLICGSSSLRFVFRFRYSRTFCTVFCTGRKGSQILLFIHLTHESLPCVCAI